VRLWRGLGVKWAERFRRLRQLDGIGVAVAADEEDDQSDYAGENEKRTGEQSQAETTGKDRAVAANRGARGDVGGAESGSEISVNAVICPEVKRAEEEGDIARDGAVRIGGYGSKEHGHITTDVAFDIDPAEGTGYVAGTLTFFNVNGGEEGDSIVAGSVVRERKGEDGGEQEFRHTADLMGKSIGRVETEL